MDAAESQFGAVASNTGTIVLLMVTLSLIGVCINMAFQFRSMDGASFFWYLIKLTLIGLFAFNWANFFVIKISTIKMWILFNRPDLNTCCTNLIPSSNCSRTNCADSANAIRVSYRPFK